MSRNRNIPFRWLPAWGLVITLLLVPQVLAKPHVKQTRCHCPCKLNCGNGVSADCTMHSEDCHHTHCVDVGAFSLGDLFPGLEVEELAGDLPAGYVDHAPWFGLDLPETVQMGFGALERETLEESNYVFTMRLADAPSGAYVVEEPADLAAWQAWLASIDPEREMGVSIGAVTDPASWRILDGDRRHLNESVAWRFHLVVGGRDVVFMRKDSTPAWEAWTYLHSAFGQLPDDAFAAGLDPARCRAELFSMLDTFHVLVEGSFFDRARAEVEAMLERCEAWLVPGHRLTDPTLGALRKIDHLLALPEETSP